MALTEWQKETLYKGAPDPVGAPDTYHPLVAYLEALEARLAAAESSLAATIVDLDELGTLTASDGWNV